jgi:hypothetical protein
MHFDETHFLNPRPYFLKNLATLFNSLIALWSIGARSKYTLFVNDLPYKNIKNNMWNIVYLLAFIASCPDLLMGYLDHK